jgi:hypothetical protein
MNTDGFSPIIQLFALLPYLLRGATEMLRSCLLKITAAAANNARKGSRMLCQRASFKENLYINTSFP